jgi:predicted amidohydrolase
MRELHIGVAQLQTEVASKDYDPRPENCSRAVHTIEQLAEQGAELVVFGEGYLTGYASGLSGQKYAVLQSDEDPFVKRLAEAASAKNVTVITGATTHRGTFPGDTYNSALVIDGSGLRGVYNKTHVPTFAMEDGSVIAEGAWWTPGSNIRCIDTKVGRLGIEICYDIMLPETARCLALDGADILINISAAVCGFETIWDMFLPVRAIENAIPYLHVSIVGKQGAQECFGGSRLFTPSGQTIHEMERGQEATGVFTADLEVARLTRAALHTFAIRKPSLYGAISADQPNPGSVA